MFDEHSAAKFSVSLFGTNMSTFNWKHKDLADIRETYKT
jgi:hypothetical protein